MDARTCLQAKPGALVGQRTPQGFSPASLAVVKTVRQRPLVLDSSSRRSTDPIRGAELKGLRCKRSAGNWLALNLRQIFFPFFKK
jgi:hypothetical protein